MPSDEPQVHSHLTDVLPDDHPLAHEDVYCAGCDEMLHAHNNECMQTWIEFENANVCAMCAGVFNDVLYSNTWSPPAGTTHPNCTPEADK